MNSFNDPNLVFNQPPNSDEDRGESGKNGRAAGIKQGMKSGRKLIKDLASSKSAVREKATHTLLEMGEDGFQLLLTNLDYRDSRVRIEVVKMLGIWGDDRATLPLIKLHAKEERGRTSSLLIFFLFFFALSVAILVIVALLSLVFPSAKSILSGKGAPSAILNSLALIQDRRALTILITNYNSQKCIRENWTIRESIVSLMNEISSGKDPTLPIDAEYKAILSLLKQDDQLCWCAMEVLKVAGNRDAINPLRKLKKRVSAPHIGSFAEETISAILSREAQLQEKTMLLRASSSSNSSPAELLRPLESYRNENEDTESLLRPSDEH